MNILKIYRLLPLLMLIIAAAGCKQDDTLLMYQEDPRIYFNQGQVIDYTFSTKPANVTTDTLYIDLRIMGSAMGKERTFNVTVDDSSTAKRGWHFQLGPQVVAAGSYAARMPVYLFRRAGLKDSVVKMYLTVSESQDFKPGYIDKRTSVDVLNKLHYQVSINDQVLKPSNWDTRWATYFGTWSRVKHIFITQAYGGASWPTVSLPQDTNFLVQSVKFALYNYELTNGPLMDENGQRVIFP